jgi:hypothetical protein
VSYHLPTTDVRLFSPQIYHQLHGSHSVVNSNEVVIKFCKEGALILIHIDRNTTNLPVMHNSFVSEKVKREHASKFWSALHATGLYAALDYFANISVDQNLSTLLRKQGPVSIFPCVGGLKNKNLSMPQKELLLWHWKLGIGMQRLQAMMQNRIFKDPLGRSQCHPPIIKTKFASTTSCAIPKCQSCESARAQQRSPKVKKVQSNLDSKGAISCNQLEVGDLCLQINLFVGLLVDFPVAMVVRVTMVDFTVGQFTMMLHLGSSGLRIRYLLGPVRPSWVRNILSSGYTTLLALR